MSYRPHAFAIFPLAGRVVPDEFGQNQAIGSTTVFGSQPVTVEVPLYVPPVVPALAAYSHSASVGSRYPVQPKPANVTFEHVNPEVPGVPLHVSP